MEVTAPIIAVTVYQDRARVVRQGQVTLDAGLHCLVVGNLPTTLLSESVRAGGQGTSQVRLLGVGVEQVSYTETPAMTVAELEKEIEALGDQDRALADRESVLEQQRTFLEALSQHSSEYLARGIAFGKAQVGDGETLLNFLSERAVDASQKRLALSTERRTLARRVKKLQQELDKHGAARIRQRYQITVEVEAVQPGDLALEIAYTVRHAGWQSLYDLRLLDPDVTSPVLEVTYLGQVWQETGEDWTDVGLTLSTARPAVTARVPELEPWYLGFYAPQPVLKAEPAKMARERAAAPRMDTTTGLGDEVEREEEPVLAEPLVAEVVEHGAAVTFHIPRRADVPSDGSPHKKTITSLPLTPTLDYVAAPKLEPVAYRRATVTNTSQVTFLPGKANVFHEDEFVGTTELDLVVPDKEFELFLGGDDRVHIERELLRRDVDKKFMRDRRKLAYGYVIRVENLLKRPAQVLVRDQIPVAANEDIKVGLTLVNPEADKKTDLGQLEWKFSLEPGQKREIRFEFSVEHPRDKSVAGLPT